MTPTLRVSQNKLREQRNEAHKAKRAATSEKAIVLRCTAALKGGGRSKCAAVELPKGVRDRIADAEADTVTAETAREEAEEEIADLKETVKALRAKLDAKSRDAFDRLRKPAEGEAVTLISVLGKDGEAYSQVHLYIQIKYI